MLEVGFLLHSNFSISHEIPLKCEYLSTEGGRTSFGILTLLHQTRVKNFLCFPHSLVFALKLLMKENLHTYVLLSLLAAVVVCAWICFVLK